MKFLWPLLLALACPAQGLAASGPPSQSKISVDLLSSYSAGASQIIQARPRVIKILGTDSGMMQAARDFRLPRPMARSSVALLRFRTVLDDGDAQSPRNC